MERETGIEPVTSSLGSWRSTAELLPLRFYDFSSHQKSRNLERNDSVGRGRVWQALQTNMPDVTFKSGTSRGECGLATPGWFCNLKGSSHDARNPVHK